MKAALLIPWLLLAGAVFSQDLPPVTEQQLENIGEETIEDDALLQLLAFYREQPLDLNTATAEDLYQLRLLTELQVQNLLRYRTLFGKLLSRYELQAVPGFDLATIRKILPYIGVGDAQTAAEALSMRFKGGAGTLLFRTGRVLERSKGYDTTQKTRYLGSRDRLLLRYTYQYKNLLYYGVTGEKDAGEQFFRGAQRWGFDFYGFHFFARNLGKIKALALGDYTLNLGQGLTQWQAMAFGKSAEVMAVKRQAPVVLPYRSAGEFYFNRGAALTLQAGRWQATLFYSGKNFSGNLASDPVERFTSFGTSGYYRTPQEVADRYRLTDHSAGGNLSFSRAGLKASLNAVAHRFSRPLQKATEPYNRFAFTGKDLVLASLDYSYTLNNLHLFGELASDRQGNKAFVQGALLSLDSKLDLSLVYRNLSKAYQAPYGNAFTESTLPSNEEGLYTGVQLRPAQGWQVAAYADVYSFPFLRYRVSAPAKGADYLAQVTYTPDRQTEVYVRYRTETKPLDNPSPGGGLPYPQERLRRALRLHYVARTSAAFTLKARTELTWYSTGSHREEGFLAYVEGAYEPSVRWGGNVRMQYFETGGYDSRIYAFESDVLYSFSIPAFADKGFRYYLNLNCRAGKRLSFWFRFAQTLYSAKTFIGSGLDEINGNRRSEIKLQVQYQF